MKRLTQGRSNILLLCRFTTFILGVVNNHLFDAIKKVTAEGVS